MADNDSSVKDNPIIGCPFNKTTCTKAPDGKATRSCVACVESGGPIRRMFFLGLALWLFGAKTEPEPNPNKCLTCHKAADNQGKCPLSDWRQQAECQRR